MIVMCKYVQENFDKAYTHDVTAAILEFQNKGTVTAALLMPYTCSTLLALRQ